MLVALIGGFFYLRERSDRLDYAPGAAIDLHLPAEAPEGYRRLHASLLTDVGDLPDVASDTPLLAAGVFGPEGATFPDGIDVTWPLTEERQVGDAVWIVQYSEYWSEWHSTGRTATVDSSGRAARGTVYHFSTIGLVDREPSVLEADSLLSPQRLHIPETQEDDSGGLFAIFSKDEPAPRAADSGETEARRVSTERDRPESSTGPEEIFLTTAVEQEYVNRNEETVFRLVPTQQRIDFAWSDQPFAVHIPFYMETVRLDRGRGVYSHGYEVEYSLSGFGYRDDEGKHTYVPLRAYSMGLYRVDGLPPESAKAEPFHYIRRGHDENLYNYDSDKSGKDDILRPDEPPKKHISLLDPPAPGWVAVYFAVEPRKEPHRKGFSSKSYIEWREVGEETSGELVVTLKRLANESFGVGERTVFKRRFPIEIRQNGWRIRETRAAVGGEWGIIFGDRSGAKHNISIQDGSTEPKAGTITSVHRLVSSMGPGLESQSSDVHTQIQLPARIYDHKGSRATIDVRYLGEKLSWFCGLSSLVIRGFQFTGDPNAAPQPLSEEMTIDGREPGTLFEKYWDGNATIARRLREHEPHLEKSSVLRGRSWEWAGDADSLEGHGTLPQDWTPDRPVGLHRLYTVDLGLSGGTKHFDVYAERLSDVEENLSRGEFVPSPVTTASELPDDGYWPWLLNHLLASQDAESRIREIRVELSVLQQVKRRASAEWLALIAAFLREPLPDGQENPELAVLGRRVEAARKERREVLAEMVRTARKRQEDLVAEGLRTMAELVESVEKQQARTQAVGRWDRDLDGEIQRLRDHQAIAELRLYDAAGWHEPEEMPRVLTRFEFEHNAAEDLAQVMQARWHLAQAESLERKVWLHRVSPAYDPAKELTETAPLADSALRHRQDAMALLHGVLQGIPDHLEARLTLAEEELMALPRLAAKLEREKQASLAAFGAYLENRGFPTEDRSGWPGLLYDYSSFFWGAGPITISGGFPEWMGGYNVPDAVATSTAVVQEETAKYQVTLLFIRRLLANGLTLAEIREITPTRLADSLTLHSEGDARIEEERARRLAQDIRETFLALPDLQALAAGDLTKYARLLETDSYDRIRSDRSWGEIGGDLLFSPRHLLFLYGPFTVAKSGGKWAYGMQSSAEVKLLQEAGQTQTLREVLAASPRLNRLGQSFASTRLGGWLQEKILIDSLHYAELEGARKYLRMGGNLTAIVMLWGGAQYYAEQSGVPGLRLVVEALAALGPQEAAYSILRRAGADFRRLLGQTTRFGAYVAQRQSRLDRLRQALDDLEEYVPKASIGADTVAVPQSIDEVIADTVPAGIPDTVTDGVEYGLAAALRALKGGRVAEAKNALRFARSAQKQAEDLLEELAGKVRAATGFINGRPPASAPATATHRAFSKVDDVTPKVFAAGDEAYTLPLSGPLLREADDAFRVGDLDRALVRYRAARRLSRAEAVPEHTRQLIDDRLALLGNATRSKRVLDQWRKASRALPARQEIAAAEVDDLATDITSGRIAMTPVKIGDLLRVRGGRQMSTSVYKLRGSQGDLYYFKQIDDPKEAAGECFAATLLNAVGVHTPSCRVVRLPGVTVQLQGAEGIIERPAQGVLIRAVDGVPLASASEPVLVALKSDYARQRIARAWLGDADDHLFNQMLASDGRHWSLDLGQARFEDSRYLWLSNETFDDTASFLHRCLDIPRHAPWSNANHYGWLARMDEMVHFDQMDEIVTAIERLSRNRQQLRGLLQRSGGETLDDAFLEQTMDVLQDRAQHLRSVARLRYGQPVSSGAREVLDDTLASTPVAKTLRPAA